MTNDLAAGPANTALERTGRIGTATVGRCGPAAQRPSR